MRGIVFGIFLFVIGCRGKVEEKKEVQAEEEFKIGMELYEKKKYKKASKRFENIIFHQPTHKLAEEAQFRLAECMFYTKEYSKAETEYEFFVRTYPRSRFTDDAAFKEAVCCFMQTPPYYLDQSLTYKAWRKFESFIKKYKDSPLIDSAKYYIQQCMNKLVKKELETAKLYWKMEKIESAILYLEDIQKNFPHSSYKEEVENLLEKLKRRK